MPSIDARDLFAVEEVRSAERVQLRLTGELDLASVGAFKAAFKRASRSARTIVVDMSELEFIDSSGLRAMIEICERPRLNGYVISFRSGSGVERALEITGLRHTLPFED